MFAFLQRFFGLRPPRKAPLSDTDFRSEAAKFPAAARTIQAYQGAFEPLFLQRPDYLTLLGLGPEAVPALQFIADVVRENPEYRQSVVTLLADPGWRLHLVAAVAVLFSHDRTDLIPPLWKAIDQGSWAAPQLGVVLSICDPEFVQHAKDRIVRGCPVAPVDIPSALERNTIWGPGGPAHRSAKNLATLLHLVHAIPSESEWADAASQAPEVQQLLQADRDRDQCDKLAAHWTVALRDRLADLGLSVENVAI